MSNPYFENLDQEIQLLYQQIAGKRKALILAPLEEQDRIQQQIDDLNEQVQKLEQEKLTGRIPKAANREGIPSNVRAGSKNFVGRETELESIHTKLEAGHGVAICAVEGMGGIGKTELALQYAAKYQQDYAAQYWLAIRDNGLAKAVVELASQDIPLPEELQGAKLETQAAWYWRHWLPAEGNLLVILDDVPNAKAIPNAAMPLDRRIKVLLTARERMLSSNFEHLTVKVLTLDEAIKLLSNILTLAGNTKGFLCLTEALPTVQEVCELVGYLPLGVELIGEYLAKNRHLSFKALRNRLHLADQVLAQEREGKLYGYRGVEAAIQISWDDLSAASKQVAMLLGLFAKADIPWDLVESVAKNAEISEADLEEARGQLDVLHLIEPVDAACDFYKVHTLVREFFRKQLMAATEINHKFRRAFVQILLKVSEQIPQTPTLDQIALFKPAIPHLELLNREMLKDILNPEQDLVWAFIGVARYYRGQGQYALAEVPYQACLSATEQQLGADHPNTATSLNNLAELYRSQGRYSEAEPLFLRSLQIREQQLGADHPHTASSLNNLAGLYELQGRYSEAEPLLQRSLKIGEQQLGADHPDTATSLNNLAALYYSQGRYSEAEPLYLRSLQISEQQLGADHPHTASSLNNLALLYQSQGRYSEAEHFYLRALAIFEVSLGIDHPNTKTCHDNLQTLRDSWQE